MNRENRAYWWRAIGLWLVLMAAETLNGLWRAKVLALWIGDAAARDVSVFTGSIVILLITFACIGWIPARSVRTLLVIGVTWVLLTIAYEFALGFLVFYRPLAEMVSDFDVLHGRLPPIGLLVLFFSPLLAARGLRATPAAKTSPV
jgi:hypothetical protein